MSILTYKVSAMTNYLSDARSNRNYYNYIIINNNRLINNMLPMQHFVFLYFFKQDTLNYGSRFNNGPSPGSLDFVKTYIGNFKKKVLYRYSLYTSYKYKHQSFLNHHFHIL